MSKIIIHDGEWSNYEVEAHDGREFRFFSEYLDAVDNLVTFRQFMEDWKEDDDLDIPKSWFIQFCEKLLIEASPNLDFSEADLMNLIYEAGGRGWDGFDDDSDFFTVPEEQIDDFSPEGA